MKDKIIKHKRHSGIYTYNIFIYSLKLKSQVSGEIKEDFMNSEFYLIRWLRSKYFLYAFNL